MNESTACLAGALLLLGSGLCSAQSKTADAIVSPLPVILAALQGHWALSIKFEPASGFPVGTEGTGHETLRGVVDGKTLLSEESWKAGSFNLSLLGVIWWDVTDRKLHAMDCNNQGKHVCDPKDAVESVVAEWNGTELSIEEPERGPDGKMVTSRVVYRDIKANSFTEADYIAATPGNYVLMSTILASRVTE